MVVLHNQGPELVHVCVRVNLIGYRVIALGPVHFVEKHLKEERSSPVCRGNKRNFLSLDQCKVLFFLISKHSLQLLLGFRLFTGHYYFF